MIAIQSITGDASTQDVLDWIFYLSPKADVFRIDDEQAIRSIKYFLSNDEEDIGYSTENGAVETGKVNSFWYRRGGMYIETSELALGGDSSTLTDSHRKHLSSETAPILEAIQSYLLKRPVSINKFKDNFTNKITNLSVAASVGLAIPETLVTNNIDELYNFSIKWKKIITKPIALGKCVVNIDGKKVQLVSTTQLLTEKDIEKQLSFYKGTSPLPSLYQQYIDKKIELRIFFFDNTCYTMAIFSQSDEQTKIDFRNYNKNKPNRYVQYKLPEKIEKLIVCLMNRLEINCGSIDMILTPQDEYVFLEVNPIGQYQWLERNCNYFISKNIAEKLIRYEQI